VTSSSPVEQRHQGLEEPGPACSMVIDQASVAKIRENESRVIVRGKPTDIGHGLYPLRYIPPCPMPDLFSRDPRIRLSVCARNGALQCAS